VGFQLGDVLAVENHPAAGGRVKTANYIDQRRLACPVRADYSQYLGFVNVKAYIVDGYQAAELLG